MRQTRYRENENIARLDVVYLALWNIDFFLNSTIYQYCIHSRVSKTFFKTYDVDDIIFN